MALFLGPVLSQTPLATLGAIRVLAVLELVSPRELLALARINPVEAAVAVLAAVVALFGGKLAAVVVGVVATLAVVLRELGAPS